jgi:hypothetical protein
MGTVAYVTEPLRIPVQVNEHTCLNGDSVPIQDPCSMQMQITDYVTNEVILDEQIETLLSNSI